MTKSVKSNFLRFWFPVIIYSGIIFCASSIPNVRTPLSEIEFDKILHLMEYAPFGFLVARAIINSRSSISGRALGMWVLVFSFLYATSDEFHQSFVPGRNVGSFDLIFDTIGGTLGGYIYLVIPKKAKKS